MKLRWWGLLLTAGLIMAAVLVVATRDQPGAIAFVDVSVVPMDSERVLERQTVIVRDGSIAELGAADRIAVPRGAQRIEGRGRFLMPGLTDMHAHLHSAHEFPLYLANGVTTVYNLMGAPAHLRWREQIATGKVVGPTIYTCGPLINHAETAAEAEEIVEAHSKTGYDSIKIYSDVSKEAYPVLVAAARSRHLLVVGHIPRAVGLAAVLAARQPIAHAEEYVYTFFDWNVDDVGKIPEAVAATREADVPVILTLVLYDHILRQAEDLPAFLTRPEIQHMTPWSRETWKPGQNRYNPMNSSPKSLRFLRQSLAMQKTLAKDLHRAGVKVLVGTDSMLPGVVPGFSVLEELRILVEIGLTPFETLRAATRYPGEFLSATAEFGTIAVGKRADLLLLEANPLAAVTNVERRVGVMARGRWLAEAALQEMLAQIPGDCAREEQFVRTQIEGNTAEASPYLREHDPYEYLALKLAADLIAEKGSAGFVKLCGEMRRQEQYAVMVTEGFTDALGSRLLQLDRKPDAIAVLTMNVEAYPQSANACARLAEAYRASGDKERAMQFHRKALEIDPKLRSSEEILKTLTQ